MKSQSLAALVFAVITTVSAFPAPMNGNALVQPIAERGVDRLLTEREALEGFEARSTDEDKHKGNGKGKVKGKDGKGKGKKGKDDKREASPESQDKNKGKGKKGKGKHDNGKGKDGKHSGDKAS